MGDRKLGFPTAVGPDDVATTVPFDGVKAGEHAGLELGDRFSWVGLLGAGAVGEVHRVYDPVLNRTIALKVLRPGFDQSSSALDRFLEEAQATSQLQHPGIVPVHDLGILPDGRRFFTMKEVRGRTLSEVIEAVHDAGEPGEWGVTEDGHSLRRLVDIFRQVCDAVAYAHRRGVLHRDIKPDNVMVGAHGEVLVMDWGLARVRAGTVEPGLRTPRSERADQTQGGEVAGTPCFMSPEQARGEQDKMGSHSDVYSLGALLFTILYGQRPYVGYGSLRTVMAVGAGRAPELPPVLCPVPEELLAILHHTMQTEIEHRLPDAGAVARVVTSYLDGSAKRERALELVNRAIEAQPRVANLRADAAECQAKAAEMLQHIPCWAPEQDKLPAWEMEHESRALRTRAEHLYLEVERLLQGALGHDPECLQAHLLLCERWASKHRDALLRHQHAEAAAAEALLTAQIVHLPARHPDRQRHRNYLQGLAYLSVVTEPAGLKVRLLRYVQGPGRLRTEFAGELGRTPLRRVEVPSGSYLVQLSKKGRSIANIPVFLERQAHESLGSPEGGDGTLHLPDMRALGADDLWVAPGPSIVGGDPDAVGSGPLERRWVPGFVMKRHAVTNGEYVAFLNDLVARGELQRALRAAPHEKGGTVGEVGAIIYGQHSDGTFYLREDADGDLWLPDWAVFNISWIGADDYARWMAEKEGLPWRLPTALEREKAGRGADGRIYPWGDRHDPSWSCMRDSRPGQPVPGRVGEFDVDRSPYGICGLAGNVRDWCSDGPSADRRYDRGGFWLGNARECRLADCHDHVMDHVAASIGLRLARSI